MFFQCVFTDMKFIFMVFLLFFWPQWQKKSAISHLHEGRSSSVTHLTGVVMQRVIVDCAIFPVLDLEEAWTLGGASVLGCRGG